jgi:hypothetical protein
MCRILPALLGCILFGFTGAARPGEEPRALIERAVQAMGGAEVLNNKAAVSMKIKGEISLPGVPGDDTRIPFTGEVQTQNSGRNRTILKADFLGQTIEMIQVSDNGKGWRSMNGEVSDLTKEELDNLRRDRHIERVSSLVVLLKDKDFTLAAADEIQVNGKPALGVKVSYKGQPDVTLYFDKESGLLAKYVYWGKNAGEVKEGLHEVVHLEYREVDFAADAERMLRAAKMGVDGPSLLEFVRGQSKGGGRIDQMKELVRKLGDDNFEVREKAVKELTALGKAAVPLLRDAARSSDPEVARRARLCLEQIGPADAPPANHSATLIAAVYLLGLRKPAGAAEVLLNALPGAAEDVAREIRAVLYAIGQAKGPPDEALVKALDDEDPVKKAAARAALGKDDGAYARQPGRRISISGLKLPMKSITHQDGKKLEEHEVLEVQLFNDFENKLFAKP